MLQTPVLASPRSSERAFLSHLSGWDKSAGLGLARVLAGRPSLDRISVLELYARMGLYQSRQTCMEPPEK